jgi:hypothetical protein
MIVHQLCSAPSPSQAKALAEFEGQFNYPLGAGRSFRISHGEDYPRFFRAIGKASYRAGVRSWQPTLPI